MNRISFGQPIKNFNQSQIQFKSQPQRENNIKWQQNCTIKSLLNLSSDQLLLQVMPAPSPLSSLQQVSGQIQYLSYLVQVIDSAPYSSSQQLQRHYNKAEYLHIVYTSAIYVKKERYRTTVDDNLIQEEFQAFFRKNRIQPYPLNQIAHQLITNGYALLAFALMKGRKKHSAFLIRHLLKDFANTLQIKTNSQQFYYFVDNQLYDDHLNDLLMGNNKQSAEDAYNWNYLNITTPGQDIIRKPYLNDLSQNSDCSKTIKLDSGLSF